MAEHVPGGWRKSRSSGNENCVELSRHGGVRDSKNPAGGRLRVDPGVLVTAVRAGAIHR